MSGGSRRTPQRGKPEKSGSKKKQGCRLWDRCGEKTETMWTRRGIVGPNDLIKVVDADCRNPASVIEPIYLAAALPAMRAER